MKTRMTDTERVLVELGLQLFPSLHPESPLHGSSHEQARVQREAPTLARLAAHYFSQSPIETRAGGVR